jgi:hypothetical protein
MRDRCFRRVGDGGTEGVIASYRDLSFGESCVFDLDRGRAAGSVDAESLRVPGVDRRDGDAGRRADRRGGRRRGARGWGRGPAAVGRLGGWSPAGHRVRRGRLPAGGAVCRAAGRAGRRVWAQGCRLPRAGPEPSRLGRRDRPVRAGAPRPRKNRRDSAAEIGRFARAHRAPARGPGSAGPKISRRSATPVQSTGVTRPRMMNPDVTHRR